MYEKKKREREIVINENKCPIHSINIFINSKHTRLKITSLKLFHFINGEVWTDSIIYRFICIGIVYTIQIKD